MGCHVEENRKIIVDQSKQVANSIASANNVSTDTVIDSRHQLEVNFRPKTNDKSAPHKAATTFMGRFKKNFIGTDIALKSRNDGSSYTITTLTDDIITKLANMFGGKATEKDDDDNQNYTAYKLEATDEGEEVISGNLKTNTAAMRKITGSSLYSGNIGQVTHKEVLQNSYDVVKAEVEKGTIEKGIINVTQVDTKEEKSITYEDNGSGMTPEIIADGFFTVAGTNKGDLAVGKRSGGFGIAKVAIFETAELIELETVRDGVLSTVSVKGIDLQENGIGYKIRVKKGVDRPNGTKLKLSFSQTYIDLRGKEQETELPRWVPNIYNHVLL